MYLLISLDHYPDIPNVHPVSNHSSNIMGSIQDSKANGAKESVPVTRILAEFVANASPKYLNQELRLKVKEVLLDFIGVTAGAAKDAHGAAEKNLRLNFAGNKRQTSHVRVQLLISSHQPPTTVGASNGPRKGIRAA